MTDMSLQRWSDSLLRAPKRTRGDRNRRYACNCGARTTKNQLKASGGLCHACKRPMTTAGQERYRDWLHNGDATGETFIAFCKRKTASVDTHPKDGDVEQAPLVSGAVPERQTPDV